MSTCQYGWEAAPTCDAWGGPSPFHGCHLELGHSGRGCECLCGHRSRDVGNVSTLNPRKPKVA